MAMRKIHDLCEMKMEVLLLETKPFISHVLYLLSNWQDRTIGRKQEGGRCKKTTCVVRGTCPIQTHSTRSFS